MFFQRVQSAFLAIKAGRVGGGAQRCNEVQQDQQGILTRRNQRICTSFSVSCQVTFFAGRGGLPGSTTRSAERLTTGKATGPMWHARTQVQNVGFGLPSHE